MPAARGPREKLAEARPSGARAQPVASDRLLALQTSLLFDVQLPKLEVLGELMDSRGEWNDAGSFVSTTIIGTLQDGSKSTLRVGRMTLDLGKRRVLARSRFSNSLTGFLGADWDWRGARGSEARAFYFVPMRTLPADLDGLLDDDHELDRSTRNTALAGV